MGIGDLTIGDLTIGEMLEKAHEFGAGCMQMIGRREDDTPTFIVVCAVDEWAADVDAALKALEAKWEAEESEGE